MKHLTCEQNKQYLAPLFFRFLDDSDSEIIGSILEEIDVSVEFLIEQDPKVRFKYLNFD